MQAPGNDDPQDNYCGTTHAALAQDRPGRCPGLGVITRPGIHGYLLHALD